MNVPINGMQMQVERLSEGAPLVWLHGDVGANWRLILWRRPLAFLSGEREDAA